MSNPGDDFKLEEWERWMQDWLLDPYTTKLDESQFRLDLFDTTEAYIVEATIEDFIMREVTLTKKEQTLTIEITPMEESPTRTRSVNFPFSLKYNPVRLYPRKGHFEIHILKALDAKPVPSVIRFQGHL
ncbi:hypothetical protein [Bacillus sp. SG-1]|uniref:hypothetical protein n=1 Tax=Bacillus sp. SG-1 TaxID=161544 RepID=UPI0002E7B356|nr:hypothetical protein [Bacillus sp. SG-1]